MQSAYIREVSSNVVVNFFAIFSTLIKEHKISIENVYNMDETGMLIYYFIASDRIYGGRDSNQLCYCWFSPSLKVLNASRMTGMDYYARMYLHQWIINFSNDNI